MYSQSELKERYYYNFLLQQLKILLAIAFKLYKYNVDAAG